MRFTEDLKARVSKAQKKIVLPETNSRRVLKAAERVLAEGYARIVLVGNLDQIKKAVVSVLGVQYFLGTGIDRGGIVKGLYFL